MANKYNKNSFLGYINNPLTDDVIFMFYKENNVKPEKCELFSDFTQSFILMIFDTYLGDDVTELGDQIKHFNWVWDKNVHNFMGEGLFFDNDILYDYFLEFMLEVFYIVPNKNKNDFVDNRIIKLWVDIFDYNKTKTNSDIDVLIEIYKIFNNSLSVI